MAPKRSVEVLILDSDSDDETSPVASISRSATASRSTTRPATAAGAQGDTSGADHDQFQADLAQAMALSLAAPSVEKTPVPGPSRAGAGESRAEMERARLERQKARESAGMASTSVAVRSTAGVAPTKRARVATLADLPQGNEQAEAAVPPPPPAASSSSNSTPHISDLSSLAGSASSSATIVKHSQRFWDGAVKRVPSAYHPSTSSFSFSDLIGPPSTLTGAIVSAFVLDPEWVIPHFPEETPLLLIMPRSKGDTAPELAQVSLKSNTFRVVPKENSPNQWAGVMHTKLMVYYHRDFCRIVIPTANAIAYDYSQMDNALYIHDFPLRSNPPTSSTIDNDESSPFKNPTHTQFSKRFFQVLKELGCPKRFISWSTGFDFSKSREVRLITSLQGKYSLLDQKEANKGGGIANLASAIGSMGFASGGRWEIEATGSSIGKYTSTWLSQFYAACLGVHPSTYFRTGKGRDLPPADLVPLQPAPGKGDVKLPIKVVFPTQEAVLGSFKGADHGGTLFCPTKTWAAKNFPRHLFHRGESKGRDRQPAHTKIILALHKYKDPFSPTAKHEGWTYLGSHNFTPSAWGSLQSGMGGPQIALNNYEMGVILPIRANSAEDLERQATELVTYNRPLVRYSPTDLPWQQELSLQN
ncbi:hypothetical protein JCM11641_003440 [Rhodosporidiobolus odoratus]